MGYSKAKKPVLQMLFSFAFILTCLFLDRNTYIVQAAGNSYYVSLTGSDTNNGSLSSPFKTFAKGVATMSAGDKLYILGGTYTERLVVAKSGTSTLPLDISSYNGQTVVIDGTNSKANLVDLTGSYINVSGLEVKNSTGYCINMIGTFQKFQNSIVHDCSAMGIYTNGKNNIISGNTVYKASTVNSGFTMSSGWGSGIKVRVGGQNILIENNTVYNNYGEGIAVTRASNTIVRNNKVYDNYSVNIYVDNSYDITVEKNFSYCTPNSGFERNGNRPYGFAIGEESYTGWGAQLARVTLKNNISAFCYKGVATFNADVSGGGLDTVSILNNTLWGNTGTALSLAYDATKQRNTVVANNIIHQADNKLAYIQNKTGITLYNNFWSTNKLTQTTATPIPAAPGTAAGANDKKGDPKFVVTFPAYLASDYILSSTSTAINGGATFSSVTDDFLGSLRPSGGVFDMGAYEFGGTVTQTASPSTPSTASPSPVPTPVAKLGDANNDNIVNDQDRLIWLANYNKSIAGPTSGDFNNSGKVDGVDYTIWLNNYGK